MAADLPGPTTPVYSSLERRSPRRILVPIPNGSYWFGSTMFLYLKMTGHAPMLGWMNNENGLPPEVQKFLDTYLHTDAQRRLFLEEYSRLANERERQAFLARYLDDVPDETGLDAARQQMEEAIARREQNKRN